MANTVNDVDNTEKDLPLPPLATPGQIPTAPPGREEERIPQTVRLINI